MDQLLQGIDRRFQALNPADVENAYSGTAAGELPWGQLGSGLDGVTVPVNFEAFNIFADFVYTTGVQQLPPICE